jgi:4,5-dihydroxyphthalate decarboxylase
MVFADVPQLRTGDFDLWELNWGYFLPALEAGWELIGLPIFPKRKPAYQYIFCRTDAGIDSPGDLAGKKVATSQYRIVIDIWVRGILKHHHGLDPSSIRWLSLRDDIFPIYDRKVQIEIARGDKNPVDRLIEKEVDAIITDISDVKLFNILENNPAVKRLFPDYVDRDYSMYKETGIYAPMHLIVMSRKLDRDHPGLAGKIYQACEQAKKVAYDDILSDMAGFTLVNLREKMKEQIGKWEDPFKYGMRANRETIDTFNRYNLEQGLVRAEVPLDHQFAASTLET